MEKTLSLEMVKNRIFIIRGQKVMLDKDLAELYGVPTKALNQAVKRNKKRFPKDFMYQLNAKERNEVVTICDHLRILKFSPQLPYAFTEQGVAMLSTVLNSERAIEVNIAIMRAFVKFRQVLAAHKELADRLTELETRMDKKDREIMAIFEVIRKLMIEPEKPKTRIGFRPS